MERIAKLAQLSTGHVRELADPGRGGHPPVRRVRPATAQRILAITPSEANVAAGGHVSAIGTWRRLQALTALGWALPVLAVQLDSSTSKLSRIMTTGGPDHRGPDRGGHDGAPQS